MAIITPHIKRIVARNEGRKHSGCKAKRYLPHKSFDADFWHPNMGIANLSTSLTINSTTVTPRFFFRSTDAVINATSNTCSWAPYAGSALPINEYWNHSAKNIVTGEPCPFDSLSDCIQFQTGSDQDVVFNSYEGTSNNGYNIDTVNLSKYDFVFECVLMFTTNAAGGLISYINSGDSDDGWSLIQNSNYGLSFYLKNNTTYIEIPTALALTAGSWYHVMLIADRSGSASWFVNGSACGRTTISTFDLSTCVDTQTFYVGLSQYPASVGDGSCGFALKMFALWSADAWLDTDKQDTFARDRHADLIQLHPDYYTGTELVKVI